VSTSRGKSSFAISPVVGRRDKEKLLSQQWLECTWGSLGDFIDAAQVEAVGGDPLEDVARHRFGDVQRQWPAPR